MVMGSAVRSPSRVRAKVPVAGAFLCSSSCKKIASDGEVFLGIFVEFRRGSSIKPVKPLNAVTTRTTVIVDVCYRSQRSSN